MIPSHFYLEHTGALSIDDSGMLEVFSRVVHLAKSSDWSYSMVNFSGCSSGICGGTNRMLSNTPMIPATTVDPSHR